MNNITKFLIDWHNSLKTKEDKETMVKNVTEIYYNYINKILKNFYNK